MTPSRERSAVTGDWEYGIARVAKPYEPHRWGMTEAEADQWIQDWLDDAGKPGVWQVIRRPIGTWGPVA